MFHSSQIYNFLVESISNYVFEEEMKIKLDSNKTEAITDRCSTKLVFFPSCQKLWKIPTKKFLFLAKLRLEAYNHTKNELLWRHFSDNFT